MYSYGSTARVGSGKRGHGGRNYRPPKERRDPNSTPPPIKLCRCVLEFNIEEYNHVEPQGRIHRVLTGNRNRSGEGGDHRNNNANSNGSGVAVDSNSGTRNDAGRGVRGGGRGRGGRRGSGNNNNSNNPQHVIKELERYLRSQYCVHLIIPGKKQTGPVAIFGETYRQALPAAVYLLNHIWKIESTRGSSSEQPTTTASQSPPPLSSLTLNGRIFVNNAQELNPTAGIAGRWNFFSHSNKKNNNDSINNDTTPLLQPYWLFQSSTWSALACPLLQDQEQIIDNNNNDAKGDKQEAKVEQYASSGEDTTTTQAATTTTNTTTTNDDADADASSSSQTDQQQQQQQLEQLKICLDNVIFRLGNTKLSQLDFIINTDDDNLSCVAIGVGPTSQVEILHKEICSVSSKNTTAAAAAATERSAGT